MGLQAAGWVQGAGHSREGVLGSTEDGSACQQSCSNFSVSAYKEVM